jgi:Domain of unknown function (DUF4760)
LSWLDYAAKTSQILAPILVLLSVYLASKAIENQKQLQKKKSAIDFFLKTQTDGRMLDLRREFVKAIDKMNKSSSIQYFHENHRDEFDKIVEQLNQNELIATAIAESVMDDNFSKRYWHGTLKRDVERSLPLVNFLREKDKRPKIFEDAEALVSRWDGGKGI